ncbi:hypothetical protein OAV88_03130 [bacterium]|nr:hypothetical protein [bacterium]
MSRDVCTSYPVYYVSSTYHSHWIVWRSIWSSKLSAHPCWVCQRRTAYVQRRASRPVRIEVRGETMVRCLFRVFLF